MPKAPPASGSFSDLYDAMQQRTSAPAPAKPPRPDKVVPAHRATAKTIEEETPPTEEGKKEGGREASLPRGSEGGSSPEPFDINERPYRKGSFMLTNEEFWSLDELKLDLQKRFDLAATKDDIARCAFRLILADYKQSGAASFLVHVLRTKTRR